MNLSLEKLWGVDYGSNLAGTTVICYLEHGKLHFIQSQKNKAADAMIIAQQARLKPKLIFIDAPLSLPIAYVKKVENPNFFYRKCDTQLKAMSPMFLGGLTARAMQLKHKLMSIDPQLEMYETYPAQQAKNHHFENYKKQSAGVIVQSLGSQYQLELYEPPISIHQLDALLAYVGGIRYLRQEHHFYGDPQEGQIFI